MMRSLASVALAGFLAASCAQSDFAGSNQTSAAKQKPKAATPVKDNKTPTTTPNDKGPKDPLLPNTNNLPSSSNNNNPSPTPTPGTNVAAARINPGTDSGQNHFPISTLPNPVDEGSNKNQGFVDLLSGILSGPGIDEGSLGKQLDDNNVVFGDEKTFHIGDGQASQSSCQAGLFSYPVSGKQYLFEFDVLAAGSISVDIGVVCGVDYTDTNLVYIAQNGQAVGATTPLPAGASTFSLPAVQLQPGHYQIAVESRTGTKDPEGNPQDADDYILGKVAVHAQGAKIKLGKVYVN
jgi:hypothetical protein